MSESDLERLDAIEKREKAATAGPWGFEYNADGMVLALAGDDVDILLCTGNDNEAFGIISVDNAAFIEDARADIPYLLALVRTLREERDAYVRAVAGRLIHGRRCATRTSGASTCTCGLDYFKAELAAALWEGTTHAK